MVMEEFVGFVHMSLERYDELLLENERMMDLLDNSVPLEEYNELQELLDSIVKIEAVWNDEPVMTVDFSKLAAKLKEKFEQSEFANKWTMKDLSNRKEIVWDVFEKVE